MTNPKAPEELLAGAVTKLRHAITPLIHPQHTWIGYTTAAADPLYTRMRDTLTTATNTCGAPTQASKAPTRMDILAWFVAVDSVVAEWPGPPATTTTKLGHYHDRTWNPTELRFVKAATRACTQWADQARHLLGDNAPSVPLRRKCPLCEQMWTHVDETRQYALRVTATMDNWHATCDACKTVWYSEAERALLRRMLDTTTA